MSDRISSFTPDNVPIYGDKKAVADLLGVSVKTVDRMRRQAMLPEPKKIIFTDNHNGQGRKILRWKMIEVINYIDQY